MEDFDIHDQETILMRYFNLRTIDCLYEKLKDYYNSLKDLRKSLVARNRSYTCMREELVDCLLCKGKVVVHKNQKRCLLFEDIEINM